MQPRHRSAVPLLRAALAGAWALVASGPAGCGGAPVCGDGPLTPESRRCVVEEVAGRVEASWPFASDKAVDVAAWAASVRALADAPGDEAALLDALEAHVAGLTDGHTRLERTAGRLAWMPVRLRPVGGDWIVAAAGEDTGVSPGERVLSVDGVPVEDWIDARRARIEASNEAGRTWTAAFLSGPAEAAGRLEIEGRGEVIVQRIAGGGEAAAPEPVRFGRIGYVPLRSFSLLDDVDAFDRALAGLEDVTGLVLDLRGNGGGSTGIAGAMAGRLLSRDAPAWEMVDVGGRVARRLRCPSRGRTFEGPVALLTDGGTFSAANYFVQRLVEARRVTLVGERTGGGAGSPEASVVLRPGVRFQVSTLVIRDAAGRHAEAGLRPDVPVTFTRAELAAGLDAMRGEPDRDKALAVALDHLGGP